jgi:predicted GIY-YIG superfamily endonuclease
MFVTPSQISAYILVYSTRSKLPLVYFEVFEDVRNAIDCEKKVKSWTRAKRVASVESSKNPKWDDLSRDLDQPQTFRFVS